MNFRCADMIISFSEYWAFSYSFVGDLISAQLFSAAAVAAAAAGHLKSLSNSVSSQTTVLQTVSSKSAIGLVPKHHSTATSCIQLLPPRTTVATNNITTSDNRCGSNLRHPQLFDHRTVSHSCSVDPVYSEVINTTSSTTSLVTTSTTILTTSTSYPSSPLISDCQISLSETHLPMSSVLTSAAATTSIGLTSATATTNRNPISVPTRGTLFGADHTTESLLSSGNSLLAASVAGLVDSSGNFPEDMLSTNLSNPNMAVSSKMASPSGTSATFQQFRQQIMELKQQQQLQQQLLIQQFQHQQQQLNEHHEKQIQEHIRVWHNSFVIFFLPKLNICRNILKSKKSWN